MVSKRPERGFLQSGLTLVEMLITLLITSIAVYGAIAGLSGVILHYRQAELRSRILHYGSYVMRDITDKLKMADGRRPIIIDSWNGFSRVRFRIQTRRGYYSVLYSADEKEGIFRELSPGENKFIRFPGLDSENSNVQVVIEDFDCSFLPGSVNYSRFMAQAFVDVRLVIRIDYLDQDKVEHSVTLPFHRRVFVPAVYKYAKAKV